AASVRRQRCHRPPADQERSDADSRRLHFASIRKPRDRISQSRVAPAGSWLLTPGPRPMSQLGFEPIFDSYIAVGLIALVLLAMLAIRPRFGSLTPRRKVTLTALRLAVVLLAVAALLRPTLIRTVRNPRPSSFIVLLDTSRSMNLPSGRSEQRRWE